MHIAFTRDKLNSALRAIDLSHPRIILHERAPQRADAYALILHRVRRLADYVHYLDPSLSGAAWARDGYRGVAHFPRGMRWLKQRDELPKGVVAAILRCLVALERAAPTDPLVDAFVRAADPDVLVVSPLILARSELSDYVATARKLQIPSVLCVASWDNLSSKGLVRLVPDGITVWNAAQRREAIVHHRVPSQRIVLTGSIHHDRWFGRDPATTPREFRQRHGLPLDQTFLVFAGSTRQGRDPLAEVSYVRNWVAALRACDDPRLREIPILLRPHPLNASAWLDAGNADLPGVVIWHREELFPFGASEAADYFDGLHHSDALVAINSTAMIDAAIVDRPVHTIALPEWRAAQRDLLHFQYLLPERGGFLREARSFEEHTELLGADLRDPTAAKRSNRGFVESFIRPLGVSRSATAVLVDYLEGAARLVPGPYRPRSPTILPIRAFLGLVVVAYRVRAMWDTTMRWTYAQASVWCAKRSFASASHRGQRYRSLALWFRQREDRSLERLEWLGAFRVAARLPAEKWVYRRLAAHRHDYATVETPPRLRVEKWLASVKKDVLRERSRLQRAKEWRR